ncbi:sulfite exporter TauE/SafE family protein [Flavobacterium franklandianum]|uniref:sulfite exporter TauE/SafE family protein n=1 Tax=Flavobacterium franklandianum TaxID=2594430 RepID=UPI00117BAA47|nr:sulfite exporter TauE/SafE family protein [Flavobacterium franklandianum]TRX27787.1 sulfite exporter TauE/SafE family protein [Flavobacterium franklandianum]
MYQEILFYVLLVLVAFLYSSVGHGGASGYLALMAFFSFAPETMRSTALLLNIFVSLIAFIQYYRGGFFKWNLFWPFALASFPAAFIGGMITVDVGLYKKILAVLLLFSVVKLLGIKFKTATFDIRQNVFLALLIGAFIGLFSGMIGIGGGIILTPIILLMHWADMKKTAAVSSLFIFVNSIAGFAGLFTKGFEFKTEMGWMIVLALIGGIAGSYFGANKFKSDFLNKLLAIVLIIASIKLIFT